MSRYSVLSDVASALACLHEATFKFLNDKEQCMLHQDIKTSNVLLDDSGRAYLADFGLALFVDHGKVAREFGYMAPEMAYVSEATKESDVYSFGVLMLEVMCGKRTLDTSAIERGEGMLVDRVWRAHEAGNILQVADPFLVPLDANLDPASHIREIALQEANSFVQPPSDVEASASHMGEIELQEVSLIINKSGNDIHDVKQPSIYAPDAEMIDKKVIANLLHLGLLCCNPNPEDRPSMHQVSQLLQSTEYMEQSLPSLPACKPQSRFSGPTQEDGNVVPLKKLESYLKLAEKCMKAVQQLSDSRKFNNEQCEYLTEKLNVVIRIASWVLEVSQAEYLSFVDKTRLAQNFKFLVALAKQTQNFIQGSCESGWIQAAITLSNVSEHVSSLGFNLELCRIAFHKVFGATGCLTLVEVGAIRRAEVEIVEQKASQDADTLLRKLALELDSLEGKNKDLANYLRERLLRFGPNQTSDNESLWGEMFNWVEEGKQLGSGGFATVYEAKWLGIPVAKKTFDGPENSDFLKEVQILSQLCHPNITSMFSYAQSKRDCSIIMELMDEDLHKLMRRRCSEGNNSQPFFILEAVDIMLQISEGVNYLHTKRIVHRDLKSMNILVKHVEAANTEIGYVYVKVTDFGVSKKKNNTTTYSIQTPNIGSRRWMPPEIMTLSSQGEKSWLSRPNTLPSHPFKCDTYSFGMVCYEILTGCVPFANINKANDMKRRIMNDHERPILPAECPVKLKVLIEKCWSPEPKDRPTLNDICLELKYVKYLLMTGNDAELASTGSTDDQ